MKDLIETNRPLLSTSIEVSSVEATEDLDASEELYQEPEASRISKIGKFLNPFNWMNRRRAIKLMQGALFGVMLGSIYIIYIQPRLFCYSSDDSGMFDFYFDDEFENVTISFDEAKRRVLERFGGKTLKRIVACRDGTWQGFDQIVASIESFEKLSETISTDTVLSFCLQKQKILNEQTETFLATFDPSKMPDLDTDLGFEGAGRKILWQVCKPLNLNAWRREFVDSGSMFEGWFSYKHAISHLKNFVNASIAERYIDNTQLQRVERLLETVNTTYIKNYKQELPNGLFGEKYEAILKNFGEVVKMPQTEEYYHLSLQGFSQELQKLEEAASEFLSCLAHPSVLAQITKAFFHSFSELFPFLRSQAVLCITPEDILEE